jgi:hypothetical protein
MSRTRRWRRPALEAGQAALIMVIGLTTLMLVIGGTMVSQTVQTSPELATDSIQHYAYRALEAGMNSYQSIVNTNPNLANCNTSTNGDALCQGAQYQIWNLVADTSNVGEVPEYYLFDNPQPVFNSDGSLATLQVQIVGVAGYAGKYVYQSSTANLAPENGYLTVLWWSDYESFDSSVDNPAYVNSAAPWALGNGVCKYDWQNTATGHSPSNAYTGDANSCTPVYFGPSDTINGPIFSNDSIYVTGSPNFGVTSPFAKVTTSDPNCIFTDPGQCASGGNVGNYNTATSADNQPHETSPSDDSELAEVAGEASPNNGCVYYGPTTIVLNGSTMTVTSPDTKVVNATGCPLNATGNLPPNGVVAVETAVATGNPDSQVVSGANPFDDTVNTGKYAQTCGDYTVNSTTMPCYFGWTGSSSQDAEGDAFVSGTLAASASQFGALTIGTSNDIIIDGNITYTDCTGHWGAGGTGTPSESACQYQTNGKNDTLGLIANQYVEVDHPIYPPSSSGNCSGSTECTPLPVCGSSQATSLHVTAPLCQPLSTVNGTSNSISIDAAILALTQSFGANNYASGSQEGNIVLYGSLQQEARGAVGLIGTSGFTKYYSWDPRLELASPPSYLNPGTASYALNSSAISPQTTCPTLNLVYGGTGTKPTCPAVP